PQFQIGADQGQNMEVSMSDMSAAALEVDKLDLTTVAGSQRAIGKLNRAIDMVSAERSKLGAFQNRLEYAINNLRSTHSNLSSAESRIRDADIANEMIEFTRNQIVSQSGTAMLAQANLIPQGVLQLLQ
ncbi:MAG: flagellin, partial [Candidatus Riflebacteria bacterium]